MEAAGITLIDAMGEALTGRPADSGEGLSGLLDRLVDVARTRRAAAAILGVSETTFYRWRRGTQRPKIGPDVVRAALRRASLPPAKEKAVKSGTQRMVITGWFFVSNEPPRRRTLPVGDHIPTVKIRNVVNAWLKGDDTRADRLLTNAIDKHYTPGLGIDAIESVDFR